MKRSMCPISGALEIIGDKWSLLIIRDLFLGKKRYMEFSQSPEGIPSSILAERLKRLEQNELIVKAKLPNTHHSGYQLTPKGEKLRPILLAFAEWGEEYIEDTISLSMILKMTDD